MPDESEVGTLESRLIELDELYLKTGSWIKVKREAKIRSILSQDEIISKRTVIAPPLMPSISICADICLEERLRVPLIGYNSFSQSWEPAQITLSSCWAFNHASFRGKIGIRSENIVSSSDGLFAGCGWSCFNNEKHSHRPGVIFCEEVMNNAIISRCEEVVKIGSCSCPEPIYVINSAFLNQGVDLVESRFVYAEVHPPY